MADKAQVLYNFWSSFGLTAYDAATIPTGENSPELPYITYETTTGALEQVLSLEASIWYKSTSWEEISKKADEIAEKLGVGGYVMPVDGGYLWLVRGNPFAQRMTIESDDSVRRIYINVQAEFLTAY